VRALKGILAQLSFFTIIPTVQADLELIAEFSFLAPVVVGITSGVLDFGFLFLIKEALGRIYPILLLPFIEVLRGFNHLDGLLDLGDALMIRGTHEDRLRALRDVAVGTGGIGLLVCYLALMFAALNGVGGLNLMTLFSLMSAEVLSRSLGLLVLGLMSPMKESRLGNMFHKKLRRNWPFLLLQSVPFFGIQSVLIFPVILALFLYVGKRFLGGSSGDLTGAAITLSFPILLMTEAPCFLCSLHL
jgi:cobalamin-5'-phosphate synthase (EC 2.7.8.26)